MNMLWLSSAFDSISTPIADMDSSMVLSLPILALTMPFIFVICIVGFGMLKDYRYKKLQHETMRLLIEKGQPIPPELFAEKRVDVGLLEKLNNMNKNKDKDDRKVGLILIAVAIGLYFFFKNMTGMSDGLCWISLIPGLIGVALLINWALSRKDKKADVADDKKQAQ